MRVLVVDDMEINRKLLAATLRAEGIESVEAGDGVEALAVLERQKADAIISDILMPRMDGYRFCREVRGNEELAGIPFIFYTSTYTSPGDETLALNCGGDRYIKKPARAEAILAALREVCDPGRERPKAKAPAGEALVMREYNEALVRKLEERKDKLERARAEVALANEALERRVRARTEELVVANEELDAFNRSVAHDLSSPLTTIDGFSHLLLDECRGKVSESAMNYLKFIRDAVRQMNELTGDLLRLARAGRAEISPKEVNLSALAAAILDDLRAAHPERRVEFVCAPGVKAVGDVGLLRIALENLLNNAWKYTGRTARARIEFGVKAETPPVYFVRDNGAGFDMKAAEKLFTTFCRLHESDDFPGTGIGLSTVHRIVVRHGGGIRAESSPNEGAAFFFTLAPAQAV